MRYVIIALSSLFLSGCYISDQPPPRPVYPVYHTPQPRTVCGYVQVWHHNHYDNVRRCWQEYR